MSRSFSRGRGVLFAAVLLILVAGWVILSPVSEARVNTRATTFLSVFDITSPAIPTFGISQENKISPDVRRDTAEGKSTPIVILLAEQADVSKAYSITDQDERGWFVYRTLTSVADRTQASLRNLLDNDGRKYQSYWAANMIVTTADAALVQKIAARPDVAHIDSNRPTRWIEDPNVAKFATTTSRPETPEAIEWGVTNVNAPSVWTMGFTGQGIVIGGLDTGIRWTHNVLKSKYRG